ncbi:hypothetical protein [Pediococcus pentosaceus]|uniref:hypothetical protein n=1 Tax=Pediococcus pentosaceus TaxID=1255 RepID=UPI001F490752|nr:hypothetical protein [Pediococcus pentosaceus]
MKKINIGGMRVSNVALGIMRMNALSDKDAATAIEAALIQELIILIQLIFMDMVNPAKNSVKD